MMERVQLSHPFDPVWDADCRVLVLGTFPSVQSRENAFYYGHPQNRFWRMLGSVYAETPPQTLQEKRAFLLRRHIALWDVLKSCEIVGSSDSSIHSAVPNDLETLLKGCRIERILLNGKTAEKLYRTFWSALEIPALSLPSTSPANAAWSLERLTAEWKGWLPA